METEKFKKIKEKIIKLKAMSKSTNENEASNALVLIQKLMSENNILESEIPDFLDTELVIEQEIWKKKYGVRVWELQLSVAVSKVFDCQVYSTSRRENYNSKVSSVSFIGSTEDVFISKEMFIWLKDCLHKEALDSSKKQGNLGPHYINSFLLGATMRLNEKAETILEERLKTFQNHNNEKALVVIDMKNKKIQDFLDMMDLRDGNQSPAPVDGYAYDKGSDCANKYKFNNQINKSENNQNLLN